MKLRIIEQDEQDRGTTITRRQLIVGGGLLVAAAVSGKAVVERAAVLLAESANPHIVAYGLDVTGTLPRTIKTGNGAIYGYGRGINISNGMLSFFGRWYRTNFDLMEPDFFGKRPAVEVTDARLGQSGRAYFLVTNAASLTYKDTKYGFIKDPNLLEVEMAEGTADLKPIANFEGGQPDDVRAQFAKIVAGQEKKLEKQ